MAPKKDKRKKKAKETETVGINRPIGAEIAPDYVTEDLTGYRVPFNEDEK